MTEERKKLEECLLDALEKMTPQEQENFWNWVKYDLHICID